MRSDVDLITGTAHGIAHSTCSRSSARGVFVTAPSGKAPSVVLTTDVVDSTRVSVLLGEEASAQLWAEHDRIARDLFAVRQGREIDKSDGFVLLFRSVADALGFAQAYQVALRQLRVPMKARTGIHIGLVTVRENRAADVMNGAKMLEIDGLVKSVAARVMSVACQPKIEMSPVWPR